MLNDRSIVDMIEKTHTDRPYCDCGRPTTTAYRDGAIWLECTVVDEPLGGRIARLWNVVTDPGHVHRLIVEVPTSESQAA